MTRVGHGRPLTRTKDSSDLILLVNRIWLCGSNSALGMKAFTDFSSKLFPLERIRCCQRVSLILVTSDWLTSEIVSLIASCCLRIRAQTIVHKDNQQVNQILDIAPVPHSQT